jgi:hypothetical protein
VGSRLTELDKPEREEPVRVRTSFSKEEAWMLGWVLGIDWDRSAFDVERFRAALDAELDRDLLDADEDGFHLDPMRTAKRALARLEESEEAASANRRAPVLSA